MPATSLALLSWSEQVSPPHTRCSKGSPLGEAPISCYSYAHFPQGTLPARNSPAPPPLATGSASPPAWGMHSQKLCPSPRQSQTSKQGSWGPAALPCLQGSPLSSIPWLSEMLSHGAAPFHGQSSEVGSPACKQLDWIKPKSTSQRVPKSWLWDYKG